LANAVTSRVIAPERATHASLTATKPLTMTKIKMSRSIDGETAKHHNEADKSTEEFHIDGKEEVFCFEEKLINNL